MTRSWHLTWSLVFLWWEKSHTLTSCRLSCCRRPWALLTWQFSPRNQMLPAEWFSRVGWAYTFGKQSVAGWWAFGLGFTWRGFHSVSSVPDRASGKSAAYWWPFSEPDKCGRTGRHLCLRGFLDAVLAWKRKVNCPPGLIWHQPTDNLQFQTIRSVMRICQCTLLRVAELNFLGRWHFLLGPELLSMPSFAAPGFCSGWRQGVWKSRSLALWRLCFFYVSGLVLQYSGSYVFDAGNLGLEVWP